VLDEAHRCTGLPLVPVPIELERDDDGGDDEGGDREGGAPSGGCVASPAPSFAGVLLWVLVLVVGFPQARR
jgi:hypothetical protein